METDNMTFPSIEHLAHIQEDIVVGIKAETKKAILAKYSWSDQMNATGDAKAAMQADIADMIAEGAAKREAVLAATTFEELNEVVPMASEEA